MEVPGLVVSSVLPLPASTPRFSFLYVCIYAWMLFGFLFIYVYSSVNMSLPTFINPLIWVAVCALCLSFCPSHPHPHSHTYIHANTYIYENARARTHSGTNTYTRTHTQTHTHTFSLFLSLSFTHSLTHTCYVCVFISRLPFYFFWTVPFWGGAVCFAIPVPANSCPTTCLFVSTCIYVHICVYVYVYFYMSKCACMCTYTLSLSLSHTHTHL